MIKLFKKSIKNIDILSNERTTPKEEEIYRNYVLDFYKKQKYTVWNHTDDIGENDKGINIISKKNRDIILIHCHLATTNISTEDVKEFEKQRDKFIEENPTFQNYEIILRYSLKGFYLTEDAFWYMQENAKFISYEIIK